MNNSDTSEAGTIARPEPLAIVPELATTAQAARLCNCDERTFRRWSRSGAAPAPVKLNGGTLVRYRRQELLDWIAAGWPRVNGRDGAR